MEANIRNINRNMNIKDSLLSIGSNVEKSIVIMVAKEKKIFFNGQKVSLSHHPVKSLVKNLRKKLVNISMLWLSLEMILIHSS